MDTFFFVKKVLPFLYLKIDSRKKLDTYGSSIEEFFDTVNKKKLDFCNIKNYD